jgi:hypothetical protein
MICPPAAVESVPYEKFIVKCKRKKNAGRTILLICIVEGFFRFVFEPIAFNIYGIAEGY